MSHHTPRPGARPTPLAALTAVWIRVLAAPQQQHGRTRGPRNERGEIPAKVIMIVGFALLAAAVVAAITAYTNGWLGKLPGA